MHLFLQNYVAVNVKHGNFVCFLGQKYPTRKLCGVWDCKIKCYLHIFMFLFWDHMTNVSHSSTERYIWKTQPHYSHIDLLLSFNHSRRHFKFVSPFRIVYFICKVRLNTYIQSFTFMLPKILIRSYHINSHLIKSFSVR